MENSVIDPNAALGGDRDPAPKRCPLLARLSAPIVSARLLLVVAHPDDETIGAGALLARSIDAHVAVVTNGAPSDPRWWPAGVASAEEYAALRREELRRALEVAGIGFERVHLLEVTDGDASQSITDIVRRLTGLLDSIDPDIVLTHAYEGGHLDHDATALAVHAAMAMTSRGHPHEMALYHGGANEDIVVHTFLPGEGSVYTAALDERLGATKSAMLACYQTQQHHAAYFGVELERYRCAPAYDFRGSPDPGRTLLCERSDGDAGERFRVQATAALQNLGLSEWLNGATDRTAASGPSHQSQPAAPVRDAGPRDPLVSVMVRTVGRATLSHALASIASQTYREIEVVLVNASTQTISANEPGLEQLRIRECGGIALDRPEAANLGLKSATGDYVMFLDDDDWFHPEHVESLVGALRRATDARVAYAGVEVLEWLEDGPPRRRWTFDSPFDPIGLLCENYIPLNAVLIDRQLLNEVDGFDEQLPLYEDWDFLIGLSRRSRFEKVPHISAAYRWPPGSGVINPARTAAAQARVYSKWRVSLSTDEYIALVQRAAAETELKTGRERQLQALQAHLQAQNDELEQLRPFVRNHERELQDVRRHVSALTEELEQLRPSARNHERELQDVRRHVSALTEELAQLRRSQQPKPDVSLEHSGRSSRLSVGQLLQRIRRRPPVRSAEPASRSAREVDYAAMMAQEVANYRSVENVHDLPDIFHYWSNKYLLPKYQEFGFSSPNSFYVQYMIRVCAGQTGTARFLSCGAGNCDTEIGLVEELAKEGVSNFVLECLDVNPHMLERGQQLARERHVLDRIQFTQADINSWRPQGQYQIVMANQALHHFVELETLFEKVYESLATDGYFLTNDMIGRNGHMRWPEALEVFEPLWSELPARYKYNHLLKRTEIQYENWDCSKEGFEGIRAQDILPLLIKTFHFELFLGFANVIDIFIDRCFGHNFDPDNPSDLLFIDKVHSIDEECLQKGIIKPTHMTAAMMKTRPASTKTHLHLTPEFCVRRPD